MKRIFLLFAAFLIPGSLIVRTIRTVQACGYEYMTDAGFLDSKTVSPCLATGNLNEIMPI